MTTPSGFRLPAVARWQLAALAQIDNPENPNRTATLVRLIAEAHARLPIPGPPPAPDPRPGLDGLVGRSQDAAAGCERAVALVREAGSGAAARKRACAPDVLELLAAADAGSPWMLSAFAALRSLGVRAGDLRAGLKWARAARVPAPTALYLPPPPAPPPPPSPPPPVAAVASPVDAWVATLAPGDTSLAREWFARFRADVPEAERGNIDSVTRFAFRLRRAPGVKQVDDYAHGTLRLWTRTADDGQICAPLAASPLPRAASRADAVAAWIKTLPVGKTAAGLDLFVRFRADVPATKRGGIDSVRLFVDQLARFRGRGVELLDVDGPRSLRRWVRTSGPDRAPPATCPAIPPPSPPSSSPHSSPPAAAAPPPPPSSDSPPAP